MSITESQLEIRWLRLACVFGCALVVGLILSAKATGDEARQLDAVPVFQCGFGDDWDVDFDSWPDRWVRKTGPGLPHYVNIAIQEDVSTSSHKCLQIDLDGASAEVESPPIRVLPRFSYLFEAQLKTAGLRYSTATLTLNFCDSNGRVLQTEKSEPISSTNSWQTIQLGKVEPRDLAVSYAVIGLSVQRGSKGDLQGHVSLANVCLKRLPRIDVTMNSPCNVYTQLDGVEVQCTLSGIRERSPEIDFLLLDENNKELQRQHVKLDAKQIVDDSGNTTDGANTGKESAGYEDKVTWHPTIPDYGFYHVVVLKSGESASGSNDPNKLLGGSRPKDIVVVPKLPAPRRGEFGWTLPDGDQPLSFRDLSALLPEVGINWVKVPLWFDAAKPRRGDEIIRFVELLGASNIDVVGIIDRPPNQAAASVRGRRQSSIADVLTQDSSTWATSLEPVMTRLSLRVRWWQLGADFDTSFASLPDLKKRISDLRTALFRFGQDVRVGMSWDWSGTNAQTGNVSWDFEQLCLDKQPDDAKFAELLALQHGNSAKRWIMIEPPAKAASTSKAAAAFDIRATEFVHRLIEAKVSGADAIMVTKPFNDENGLMRADGMPTELLLPWRTTASLLGGSQYIGQMQLPNGSENRIFLRGDGQVVMVAWNREATREALYLGDHVKQIDLLGRSKNVEIKNKEQTISVGSTPTFVLGLHEAVTRWRMSAEFEKRQVPSIFGKPHHNSLHFKNYFPQGVGGTMKIVVLSDRGAENSASNEIAASPGFTGDRWTIEPPQGNFQLAANAEVKIPFDIQMKNVRYGRKPVRIDFAVEADEKLEFSIYRYLEIGTEDLSLEVKSHLDKEDNLVVEQTMTNGTKRPADFKCSLWVPGRRPQRMQVYRLGKSPARKVYRVANGSELIGKELWLELEELNGQRTVKYRFTASAETDDAPTETKPSGAGSERAPKSDGSAPGEPADRRPAFTSAKT